MSQKPYQREQGDFELRILRDGRLVMIAPDETLLEIAQALEATGAGDETPETADNEIVERGTVARLVTSDVRRPTKRASQPQPLDDPTAPPSARRTRTFAKADLKEQHLESQDAETAAPGRE